MAKYIKTPFTVVDAFVYDPSPEGVAALQEWLVRVAGLRYDQLAAGDAVVVEARGKVAVVKADRFAASYGPPPTEDAP